MAARAQVLSAFKEIHRTCQSVFAGHKTALKVSRWKINNEFKRYKDETVPKKIEDNIQFARDASRLLKLTAEEGSWFPYNERRTSRSTHYGSEFSYNDRSYDYHRRQQYRSSKKSRYIDFSNFDISELRRARKKS